MEIPVAKPVARELEALEWPCGWVVIALRRVHGWALRVLGVMGALGGWGSVGNLDNATPWHLNCVCVGD